MTHITDHMRARLLTAAVEEAARELLDGSLVFSEILGQAEDVQVWQRTLTGLKGKRPGMRFLEVCYRHDNPEKWADFLAHELQKSDSPWQRSEAEERAARLFCQRLSVWWCSSWWSPVTTGSDQKLSGALQPFFSTIGAWVPKIEDLQRWRLMLLRRVFRHLLREEAA